MVGPGFSLYSLSCVLLVPSEYLHDSHVGPFPGVSSQSLSAEPAPSLWACKPLLAWECCLACLCGKLSILPAVAPSPLEVPKLLPDCLWEGFWACGDISAFTNSLPYGTGPWSWNPLSLFFYPYLLPCLILWRLTCLLKSLGSSASIQNVFCRSCSTRADEFLICLWRGR